MAISEVQANLERLAQSYPGRLLIVGISGEAKAWWQFGIVMGRSAGSRNRILEMAEGGAVVRTVVFNPSEEAGESDKTIYNMVVDNGHDHIISNGRQSDTFARDLKAGHDIWHAMRSLDYEDDPAHTARITAIVQSSGRFFTMCRVSINPLDSEGLYDPFYGHYRIAVPKPGYGFVIQTYTGDGGVKPSRDEPYPVALQATLEEAAEFIWQTLDKDNRVALVAKEIARGSGHAVRFAPLKNARLGD
ncbi:hypothetical protein HYS93_04525 [Candidatus Daviesbacteria bacterium]|nr:hypothetical protein [Candidatus Daviesbacteria bacterium]